MSAAVARSPRALAAQALIRIERGGYANLVLSGLLEESGFPPRDRNFAARLVYGTLERQRTLDARLNCFLKKPIDRLDAQVRVSLRLGLYQILYMDAVPTAAAVSESVKLTRSLGKSSAAGMVNAVLRRAGGSFTPQFTTRAEQLGVEYSVSDAVASLLYDAWGERAQSILAASFRTPAMTIRVNTLKITAQELMQRFTEKGIAAIPAGIENGLSLQGVGEITRLPEFREGLFHVQGAASQIAAAALDPQPGQRVLDLCAAPGGKSATLAQRMKNQGALFSCDAAASRLSLIEKLLSRLGITCVQVLCNDATIQNPDLTEMDRVLCDVPCSGLGVLAKKPDIRYKDLKKLPKLIQTQRAILETGAAALRTGGRLVYSTCTINPEENQQIVRDFLAEHPEFRLLEPQLTGDFEPLREDGMLTFLPDICDTDGFFVACLERLW